MPGGYDKMFPFGFIGNRRDALHIWRCGVGRITNRPTVGGVSRPIPESPRVDSDEKTSRQPDIHLVSRNACAYQRWRMM